MPRDIELDIPYPPRISPDTPQARVRNVEWLTRNGLLTTQDNVDRYLEWDMAQLAGRLFPDAYGEDLDLGVLEQTFFFFLDDIFDGDVGKDPAQADALCHYLVAMVRPPGGSAPVRPPFPLAGVLSEILKRSRDGMPDAWIARAGRGWENHFLIYVTEAADRRSGPARSLDAYMERRRISIGLSPTLDLAESIEHFVPSPALHESTVLKQLCGVAAEILTLTNDAQSLEKDEANGDDNMILILARERGLSRDEAIEAVPDMVRTRIAQFEELALDSMRACSAITDSADEWAALMRFVQSNREIIRANYDWGRRTDRYGARGVEQVHRSAKINDRITETPFDPPGSTASATSWRPRTGQSADRHHALTSTSAHDAYLRGLAVQSSHDTNASIDEPMAGGLGAAAALPAGVARMAPEDDCVEQVGRSAKIDDRITETPFDPATSTASATSWDPRTGHSADHHNALTSTSAHDPHLRELALLSSRYTNASIDEVTAGGLGAAAAVPAGVPRMAPEDDCARQPPHGRAPALPASCRDGASSVRQTGMSTPAKRKGETVAVFGGGVAGLTAAHELAERGFHVTVYERRAWGGKARSTRVADSGRGGRRALPGEHAFRVECGFYQNVPDTMRRIPFASNPNGVFDNLREVPQLSVSRENRDDLVLPVGPSGALVHTPARFLEALTALLVQQQVPPAAASNFARRMIVYSSSCDARRSGEWERTSWAEFVREDDYSEDFRMVLDAGAHLLQASKAKTTSAKFTGWFLELALHSLFGRGANGPTFRMLALPTSKAWIDPWTVALRQLGVDLCNGQELTRLVVEDGSIATAEIRTARGMRNITADWYVCALPVERARALWGSDILKVDPDLAQMHALDTGWYTGVQFYLSDLPRICGGFAACADSPWRLAFVEQAQFWSVDFASTYGDGRVRECLSTTIASWDTPGILFGKPAAACTPSELVREVWAQLKTHVNKPGRRARLTDGMVLGCAINDGMVENAGRLVSEDPLVLATVGTEQYRPDPGRRIHNLALAGDYLSGDWEIATMEAASYAGRRAANIILERAGSTAPAATAAGPYRAPEWEPLKAIDAQRYVRGEPNMFDAEDTDIRRTLESADVPSAALYSLA